MRVLVCLCLMLLATGCGSGKLQTRGHVLKGGQPFVVPEGEYVRLIFVPIVEAGNPHETYVAEYNRQNGSFIVAGKDLQGMPPSPQACRHFEGRFRRGSHTVYLRNQ
jgi:hypothetical protein